MSAKGEVNVNGLTKCEELDGEVKQSGNDAKGGSRCSLENLDRRDSLICDRTEDDDCLPDNPGAVTSSADFVEFSCEGAKHDIGKERELEHRLEKALESLRSQEDQLECTRNLLQQKQEENEKLCSEVQHLQKSSIKDKQCLDGKVKTLQDKCLIHDTELQKAKEKQLSHDQAAKKAIAALEKEMALRVDQVTKMYDDVLKEKESLVIKVAQGEEERKQLLNNNDSLERKMNEHTQEIDKYRQKLKSTMADLNKLQTAFDEKEKQLQNCQKDSGKMSEELNSHMVKVKWAQNKLKQELENHKETKVKLAQSTQKFKEAKEEGEQIRADCQAMIKKYQESEEMRSNSLDHKLKQKEHELRRHEQEIADQDEVHKMKIQELGAVKEELRKSQEEVCLLKGQVSTLEEKITHYALKVATHEKNTMLHKKEQQSTRKELEESQTFKSKFEGAQLEVERLNALDAEQKCRISELETETIVGRSKESELLGFTEKMTTHNAQLQSEISALQGKLDANALDKLRVEEKLEQLVNCKHRLEAELADSKASHARDADALKLALENKTKAVSDLTLSLEDARDQFQVAKRKNAAIIKDLTRQLQQSRKQVDKLESSQLENLSGESKSSSTNSLDKINGVPASGPVSPSQTVPTPECRTDPGVLTEAVHVVCGSSAKSTNKNNEELEPDRAALIERICRLQKIHAKKNEKIEFMEEHVAALIQEIQKKSRIIQYYVLRETSGTLAPPKSDFNKAQLSRHGGIMASVYSSKPVDRDMTLELSLEINRKLQAVLEDTILKNMTLKENIDTLGDEITRLNESRRASQNRRQ